MNEWQDSEIDGIIVCVELVEGEDDWDISWWFPTDIASDELTVFSQEDGTNNLPINWTVC